MWCLFNCNAESFTDRCSGKFTYIFKDYDHNKEVTVIVNKVMTSEYSYSVDVGTIGAIDSDFDLSKCLGFKDWGTFVRVPKKEYLIYKECITNIEVSDSLFIRDRLYADYDNEYIYLGNGVFNYDGGCLFVTDLLKDSTIIVKDDMKLFKSFDNHIIMILLKSDWLLKLAKISCLVRC